MFKPLDCDDVLLFDKETFIRFNQSIAPFWLTSDYNLAQAFQNA
jgi:hypothetical protein